MSPCPVSGYRPDSRSRWLQPAALRSSAWNSSYSDPVGGTVAVSEGGDHLLPGRRVRGVGDLRAAGGEELLFLELDSLPGRVADDAGEAACPAGGRVDVGGAVADAEDVRELDVPVEEAVLAGEVRRPGPRLRPSSSVPSSVAECLQGCLGDRGGAGVVGLGLDEGGAPGVGEQLLDAAFGRFGELQCLALLVDVQVFEAVGQCAGDLRRRAWRGPCW